MKIHPRVTMNLGEENELRFACSVKGSTSDPALGQTPPRFRFQISETSNTQGPSLTLSTEQVSEGNLLVRVPNLEMFEEGKEYQGVLEVIVGSRIINPIALPIIFERRQEEGSPLLLNEEASQVDSVIKPEPKVEVPKRVPSTLNEKLALGVLFTERKAPEPTPEAPTRRHLSPELEATKAQLKKLLQEAWSEF